MAGRVTEKNHRGEPGWTVDVGKKLLELPIVKLRTGRVDLTRYRLVEVHTHVRRNEPSNGLERFRCLCIHIGTIYGFRIRGAAPCMV